MESPTLLTLPQLAAAVQVEYRTLHNWVRRGLLIPSIQRSSGTGIPNLFSRDDAVKAKVIADLRQHGVAVERLLQASAALDAHPAATEEGAVLIINGRVAITDAAGVSAEIAHESPTLVYDTQVAIRAVDGAIN